MLSPSETNTVMRTFITSRPLSQILVTLLGCVLANPSTAQTFRTLYGFTGSSDGRWPNGSLALSGDTLYGTTIFGGSGAGTVFAIKTDGTGFTNLYLFADAQD